MRLIVLASLTYTAFAGIQHIQHGLSQVGLFHHNDRKKRDLSDFEGILDGTGVNIFNGYGCWCVFDDKFGLGRGDPVDETDKMCRVLAKSYSCANFETIPDGLGGFSTCKPWEQAYNSPGIYSTISQRQVTDEEIRAFCTEANPDDVCAWRTCTLDTKFIAEIYYKSDETLSWDNFAEFDDDARSSFYDPLRQHSATWERETACPSRPSQRSGDRTRECCGQYPNKFPFFTAFRGCCDDKSYVKETKGCCANSKIFTFISGKECCGTEPFDPATRTCVADEFLINQIDGDLIDGMPSNRWVNQQRRKKERGRYVGVQGESASEDSLGSW